ncbi:MAG: MG2 domain-containing protein, partial [Planctomycetota bacterium]|nr:MG2 domain-containing protein [Planctomycetota bacterium]
MPTKRLTSLMIVCAAAFSLLASAALREDLPPDQRRAAMKNLLKEGNFREAYDGFRELALDPSSDPETVGGDLREAIQCLTRLNRTHEVDDFREAAIEAHAGNWRLLHAAAETYLSVAHHGYEIAGEFRRGHHRGGGKRVNSSERDRARALQLLHQAVRSLPEDTPKEPAFLLHRSLAAALLHGRDAGEAWRLGYLSDLDSLPDTEETWNWYARRDSGAPVDEEGQPLVHALPESWEAARTDGERWRWALLQQLETLPGRRGEVLYGFARFLHGQFGVQTMGRYRHVLAARSSKTSEAEEASEAEERDESGTWELHTLADDETIARLATGIRRFRLPDEFSPIKVFRQVVDSGSGYGPAAMERLAIIFENRRQYPKAADAWRQSIEKYGESEARKRRLEQIVGNWGRFESGMTQPAGEGATVEFRHRNGEAVTFRAHEIRVKTLLDDVKAYVKSKPERLDWNRVNIGNIGHRLVGLNETKYVGELVATWKLDLDPREKHFDRRISVTTPLQKAGAYLLTAEIKDGNTSKIVVWLSDTSIVRKPLDGEVYYFVADAVTGRPVARANLELFGYQRRRVSRGRYEVFTRNFAEFTDADGQVFLDVDRTRGYQWIATATTRDGRFAHLGFSSVWHRSYHDTAYQQVRAFTITDRPAYRPGQTVHFKSWVRESKYDKDDTSRFAGNTFPVAIHDAKGEKVFSADLTADDHGGLEAEYVLPEGAALGVYR